MEQSSVIRILTFLRILLDETDEKHPLSREEIEAHLAKMGITINRKTFYSYIEQLKAFGYEIESIKTDKFGYYIKKRTFQFAQAKLLVDAVQSSRFIEKDISEELISAIGGLLSKYQSAELKRKLYMDEQSKSLNKELYKIVDTIYEAIRLDRQIGFRYADLRLDIKNETIKQFRKDGKQYVVSPYSLVWAQDNYYVVTHYPEYAGLTNFRVDRIDSIIMLSDKRVKLKEATQDADFSLSQYVSNIFSMYRGETQKVRLRLHKELLNTFIDRFGSKADFKRINQEWIEVNVDVQVSPPFYAWVFQFKDKVVIEAPTQVITDYTNHLLDSYSNYKGESNGKI